MVMRIRENNFGAWAFLIGVLLAAIIGFLSTILIDTQALVAYSSIIYGILVVLGFVVGFSIKTQAKDSQTFLIAGAILVVISKFGMESVTSSLIGIGIGDIVSSTFAALLALFVPATIIVALKTVFALAQV